MKHYYPLLLGLMATLLGLSACHSNNEPTPKGDRMVQVDSLGWWWQDQCPVDPSAASWQTSTDAIRLHFYGWNLDEDSLFTVTFPEQTNQYGRAMLAYTMCGWNKGPADWDMTTQILIQDKQSGEWYEFTRAITPYGGAFNSTWSKTFYIDITEFLPLMQGETSFRIFYCGWDATDEKAHAVQLTYLFYEGTNPYGTPCYHHKIYDSRLPNEGSNGYRAWSYGVKGYDIEDSTRLCPQQITIPAGCSKALFRICLTGHGQDAYNGTGTFPDREGKQQKATNCAEFDHNYYHIILNGDTLKHYGEIWEVNKGNTYYQAGTYAYNRGGWGPGKPCNVQHWLISDLNPAGETISLDLQLDRYISPCTTPNQQYVACYYVEVDMYCYR